MASIHSGKSFGALKAVVLRVAKNGYAPDDAMLTVKATDRERLRALAVKRGTTIADALSYALDEAGAPRISPCSSRTGRLAPLVERLIKRLKCRDGNELYSLLRSGYADDALMEEYSKL